ncbi:MAG TPA: hypothetical protein VMS96_11375 [Terriglobales bacterium]|nr:hypothetical protein [Terriglobales bacterium]
MTEHHHEPDLSSLRNPGVSYEPSDASVRGVVWFLVVLTLAGILIHLVLVGLYKLLAGPGVSLELHQAAGSVYAKPPQPPEPRLQADAVVENNQMREQEEQRLTSYGWVDQAAGVTHIPIERAMDLVAQRGIPARPPQPATQYRETLNMGVPAPGGMAVPAAEAQKRTPPQK